jgi:hypothetical protein
MTCPTPSHDARRLQFLLAKLFVDTHMHANDDEYRDYAFSDRCPKAARRYIVLTHVVKEDRWFAVMERSKTDEDEFLQEHFLPDRFVTALRCIVSMQGGVDVHE